MNSQIRKRFEALEAGIAIGAAFLTALAIGVVSAHIAGIFTLIGQKAPFFGIVLSWVWLFVVFVGILTISQKKRRKGQEERAKQTIGLLWALSVAFVASVVVLSSLIAVDMFVGFNAIGSTWNELSFWHQLTFILIWAVAMPGWWVFKMVSSYKGEG